MFERINLVPQLALAGKIRRIMPVVCGITLLAGCALIFFLSRQVDIQNQELSNKIERIESKKHEQEILQASVIQLDTEIKELQKQERELYRRVANFEQLPKQKLQHSQLLINVASVLPASVRCEKIELNRNSGQLSGVAIVYRDLPAFVKALNEMPDFHSVSLEVLKQNAVDTTQTFTFNIALNIK